MAEHGDHFPVAPADRELVAVHHAAVALRHGRHAARIAAALADGAGDGVRRHAVGDVEGDRVLAVEARAVVVRGVRREILRRRHPHGRARAFHEPCGAAHVVGMVVRDDDVLHGLGSEKPREVPLPDLPRGRNAVARVDQREPVAVVEDPEIDMVEREGQRHADPPHAGGDLDRLSRLRNPLFEGMRDYLLVQTHSPFHAGPGVLARKCSMRFR
jgi:hypothetical protein